MTIRMQSADGTEPLREIGISEVATESLTSDLTWLEVRNPTDENLSKALEVMKLHSVVRDACMNLEPFPQTLLHDARCDGVSVDWTVDLLLTQRMVRVSRVVESSICTDSVT